MTISQKLQIKEKRKGDYYRIMKKEHGKKEAERAIYKQVMGFYPEEAWMYGEK